MLHDEPWIPKSLNVLFPKRPKQWRSTNKIRRNTCTIPSILICQSEQEGLIMWLCLDIWDANNYHQAKLHERSNIKLSQFYNLTLTLTNALYDECGKLLNFLIWPDLISRSYPKVFGISEPELIIGDRKSNKLGRKKINTFPCWLFEFIDFLPLIMCWDIQYGMLLSQNQSST